MKSYGKNTHLTLGAIYEIMKNVLFFSKMRSERKIKTLCTTYYSQKRKSCRTVEDPQKWNHLHNI